MTSAPPGLLATRAYLLDELPGLTPGEAGIVGDVAHIGGYHCGRDRLRENDYSNRTTRDRAGLTLFASALDVGMWSGTFGGKTHNLRTFSVWLVDQCKANAPDTRDIREVIYSPDGKVVKRFDNEGGTGTGDDNHRFHTHISVYRDATKAGRGLFPVMQRYVNTIKGVDDMAEVKDFLNWNLTPSGTKTTVASAILNGGTLAPKVDGLVAAVTAIGRAVAALPETDTAALEEALEDLAERVDSVDEQVIAGLSNLDAEDLVTVLRSGVPDWAAFKALVAATN